MFNFIKNIFKRSEGNLSVTELTKRIKEEEDKTARGMAAIAKFAKHIEQMKKENEEKDKKRRNQQLNKQLRDVLTGVIKNEDTD